MQDVRSQALSAKRVAFEVPPAGTGVSLGSPSLLRRVEAAGKGTTQGNPLAVGGFLVFPDLEASFVADSRPELPLFVGVYPVGSGPVELTVELRRGRSVVAQTEIALPDPDGRIPWIGGISSRHLTPGSYEIVVRARQGEARVEERTRLEVTAASKPGAAE